MTLDGPKWLIVPAMMLAAMMAFLDISAVWIALPSIRATFGVSIEETSAVTTVYMIANVIIMPMTAWLQRRFGFRRFTVGALMLFVSTSISCGLAPRFELLVLSRALQGLAGGALIPTCQALLLALYPPEKKNLAAAYYGMGALLGPILGPAFGARLLELGSWREIFFINVPIGVFSIVVLLIALREPMQSQRRRFDLFGAGLMTAGLGSLVFVLEEGQHRNWFESELVLGAALLCSFSLSAFVFHSLNMRRPLVDLSLFANRQFTLACIANAVVGVPLFAGSLAYSLFTLNVLGYSPVQAGTLLLLANLVDIPLIPITAWLCSKVDPRRLVIFGLGMVVSGLVYNATLSSASSQQEVFMALGIRAVGFAFVYLPLGVTALSEVSHHDQASATGLFYLLRELGGSCGIALCAQRLASYANERTMNHLSEVSVWRPEVFQLFSDWQWQLGTLATTQNARAAIFVHAVAQAGMESFAKMYLALAATGAVALIAVFMMAPVVPTSDVSLGE